MRRAHLALRTARAVAVRFRFAGLVAAAALLGAAGDDLWGLARGLLARKTSARPDPRWRFVCPMHPGVVRDGPGKCPSCGMPLARRAEGLDLAASRAVGPMRLEGIAFAQVERRPLLREITAPASLELDERRVVRLSTPVRAAVQQLFVAAPGTPVRRGEILAALASRELFAFARELQGPAPKDDATVVLARQRLLQMGLTEAQVGRIHSGRDPTRLDVISPLDGILVSKAVSMGDQIAELAPLLTVADIGRLWLAVRLAEEDALLARPGTPVEAELASARGLILRGSVQWLEAAVDPQTRTLAARAEIENPEGALRPGMAGLARLRVSIGGQAEAPLVVPASAVVDTGERQMVWRQGMGECAPRPVEVKVTARAGAFFAIADGLAEGDRVVARGAFLLSADQRLGEGGAPAMGTAARSGAGESR